MQKGISGRLKLLLMIHAILGIVIGLAFLFIPAQLGSWMNVPIEADFTYRMIGAAVLAFGLSSVLAYRRESFGQIQLLVEAEIVWTLLAALVLLWAAIQLEVVPTVPVDQESMTRILLYGSSVLMGLFFIAFTYCFMTEEAIEPVKTQEGGYVRQQ